MNAESLIVAFFAGLVGFAIFVYGKKQSRMPHLAAGLILMVYPYFVSNVLLSASIGVAVLLALVAAVKLGI